LSCEVGACVTEEAPASLPVAPWLVALPVLGPEEPAVPLMVWPVDRGPPARPVDPLAALPLAAEPPPLDPPEVCAKASEEPPTSKLKITAM